jgi:hypothetical protein
MSFSIDAGAAALGALVGAGGGSWRDRLREAAYNSPTGTRIKFYYFEVSREFDFRTTDFEFPGINDAYVQQNGYGKRRYPLRCVFAGAQHDLEATAFEAALIEPGLGKLEHPVYGPITVVPTGTLTRRDDLKNAANQTVIEITFSTTTGAVYPSSSGDAQSEILAALGLFDVELAQQFAASVDISSVTKQAGLLATIRGLMNDVSDVMSELTSAVATVRQAYADIESTINLSLDVFVGQPLLLAQQVSNLLKAPGRTARGLASRLDAYATFCERVFASDAGNPESTLASSSSLSKNKIRIANDFQVSGLFALAAVGGAVNGAIADPIAEPPAAASSGFLTPAATRGINYTTRPQAIAAAAELRAQFDAAVLWRDGGFEALGDVDGVSPGRIDTGAAYRALQTAVALAQGALIQSAFDLLPERQIVLDRPRSIIDLTAELYGTVDGRLDFLVETNDLTGDQLHELDRGSVIKYYV